MVYGKVLIPDLEVMIANLVPSFMRSTHPLASLSGPEILRRIF